MVTTFEYTSSSDRMSKTIIHHVVGIDGTTLIVFHTEAQCWQFRLISPVGAVLGERKIYYTAEAALKAGLEWSAWELSIICSILNTFTNDMI